MIELGKELAEKGLLPDLFLHAGIRKQLSEFSGQLSASAPVTREKLIAEMKKSPIAATPTMIIEQHSELSLEFYQLVNGSRLNLSSGYWLNGTGTLDDAESKMLDLYTERAQLGNGLDILVLNAGWGSVCLQIAERFPGSNITAISSSRDQTGYIKKEAEEYRLHNLSLVTRDMEDFRPGKQYDRVLAIELFEKIWNYEEFLRRISGWLNPWGTLFIQTVCHREHIYRFGEGAPATWAGENFLNGRIIPSKDIFTHFNKHMKVQSSWDIEGVHYARTLDAWLTNLKKNRKMILSIFDEVYGSTLAKTWFHRWRIFLILCREAFTRDGGSEWMISQQLLSR